MEKVKFFSAIRERFSEIFEDYYIFQLFFFLWIVIFFCTIVVSASHPVISRRGVYKVRKKKTFCWVRGTGFLDVIHGTNQIFMRQKFVL